MFNPHKFQNKYRVPSSRLPGYDYGRDGWYFVTICTKDRTHYFGEIKGGKMKLSGAGHIVLHEWFQTAKIRPYVRVDAFVIMPNHVHGIITVRGGHNVETLRRNVSTRRTNDSMSVISPHAGSIPEIIRSFKSITTRTIHRMGIPEFQWQPRYHDRVIRDADELEKIRWYIRINPKGWGRDRNNLHS